LENWFRSPDEGQTWLPTLARLPGIAGQVTEDRLDPQTVYMSYYPGPFALSRDGGQSWQVVSAPFGANNRGWNLAQDAAGVLYLQASQDGTTFFLYASRDGGTTWTQIPIGRGRKLLADGSMIFHFWADPEVPGMLYAFRSSGNNSAFLVTTDGGKNWKRRERGWPHRPSGRLVKAFNPSNFAQSSVPPYTIYALGNLKQGGYFSDDRGKHWHRIRPMTGTDGYFVDGNLKVKPGTNDTLWALANEPGPQYWRFAESLDKGRTWTIKGALLPSEGWTEDQLCGWTCPSKPPDFKAFNLMVSRSGAIVINKVPQGLVLSTDGGNTFRVHNGGAMAWSIPELFKASDGTVYACGDWGYLWKSGDGGRVWRLCGWAPYISLREEGGGAILGTDWAGGLWAYSQGRAQPLTWGPPGSGDYPAIEVAETGSGERIFLGGCLDGSAIFFRSDDRGATWTALGTAPGLTGLTALSADPRNPDFLVAAGWNGYPGCGPFTSRWDAMAGGITYSSDGGLTWTAAMDGNRIGGVTCLYRDKHNPDLLVASATGYVSQADGAWGGVFVSLDGGRNWEPRNQGLPSFTSNEEDPRISAVVSPPEGQTLFAAVQLNGGIYRSDDLGLTWTKVADLPLRLPDDYIAENLCTLTIRRTAVTQILPLDDGTGELLIATMHQGVFRAIPSPASYFPPQVRKARAERNEAIYRAGAEGR